MTENRICPFTGKPCLKEKCELYIEVCDGDNCDKGCAIRFIAWAILGLAIKEDAVEF